jgi:hypothetical protein
VGEFDGARFNGAGARADLAFMRLFLCTLALAAVVGTGFAHALPNGNPANKLAKLPIDGYRYDHAEDCRKRPAKGTQALASWLDANAGGVFWGIIRCERWGKGRASLHAEGRAIDWHLDVHDPADRRAARQLIDLLLATDSAGNPHALARRMGVQEIIWDCRSWWSGSEGMGRYSLCYDRKGRRVKVDDTSAHRDHVHIGLSRAGARMLTSFWRR